MPALPGAGSLPGREPLTRAPAYQTGHHPIQSQPITPWLGGKRRLADKLLPPPPRQQPRAVQVAAAHPPGSPHRRPAHRPLLLRAAAWFRARPIAPHHRTHDQSVPHRGGPQRCPPAPAGTNTLRGRPAVLHSVMPPHPAGKPTTRASPSAWRNASAWPAGCKAVKAS